MASNNEAVVRARDSPLRVLSPSVSMVFHGYHNEHILCVYHLLARTSFFPQHNFPT